jgi:hypothetical protein
MIVNVYLINLSVVDSVRNVFGPILAVVGAKDDNLPLSGGGRGKVRYLEQNRRPKALQCRADFEDARSERFAFHKRRREGEGGERLVLAVDAGGLGDRSGRYHHSDTPMPADRERSKVQTMLLCCIIQHLPVRRKTKSIYRM